MKYQQQYKDKLRTVEQAVSVVKSGNWVDYTTCTGFPVLLDRALAKRRDELFDVKIRGNLLFGPIETVECDETREHFFYNSWHCSPYERKLTDRGLCSFIPMVFRQVVPYYRHFLDVNVAMCCATPMDNHGYFNLSCHTGVAKGILDKADIVILEINENLPKVYGGFDECIHIDEVDYIVEGDHGALPHITTPAPTESDIAIANQIAPLLKDGDTLQLGIGGMPGAIGNFLCDSDLKDFGMHTELCSDAYLELYEAGKLSNKKKTIHNGKGMTGIAFGTEKLYQWVNENPGMAFAPLEYVNSPSVLRRMDNMISINSAIFCDIYGQVSAETAGRRHISGTGGQLDYLIGATDASGGKAFICIPSTFTDKLGAIHSCIKPQLTNEMITDPRNSTHYIVTEYGAVNLVGRTVWEKAELLISVAHPQFRDELIKEAEMRGLWKQSNRR